MTFLEQLQSHRGGLIRLKTELFWYGGRGFDDVPGRVCLLLDAVGDIGSIAAALTGAAETLDSTAALLLIDGCPQWVWVSRQDVEFL
jgi:hypothetical protein